MSLIQSKGVVTVLIGNRCCRPKDLVMAVKQFSTKFVIFAFDVHTIVVALMVLYHSELPNFYVTLLQVSNVHIILSFWY